MDEKHIRKAAENTDRVLALKQKKHIRMVEKSIINLQNKILDNITRLKVTDSGRVEGLKVNIKQAQSIHKKIEQLFGSEFSKTTREIVNDFDGISTLIEDTYTYLGESAKFTSIDKTAMEVLKDGYYQEFADIGQRQKNKVIQTMYNEVIGGGNFSDLVGSIQQALLGSTSSISTGRPLIGYARLYARDMVMDFHNEVNLRKAEEIDIKHFLYVGNIMATSRPFCKSRAGKYYTRKQIDSWTYAWAGKKGPAFTNRGGYNCRHHWQPIRPEWLDGKKKVNVGDWDYEQRQKGEVKIPKTKPPKTPKAVPPKKTKPKTPEEKINAVAESLENNYNIQLQESSVSNHKPFRTKKDLELKQARIEAIASEMKRMEKKFPGLSTFIRDNSPEILLHIDNNKDVSYLYTKRLPRGTGGCQYKSNILLGGRRPISSSRINIRPNYKDPYPNNYRPWTAEENFNAIWRHEFGHRFSGVIETGSGEVLQARNLNNIFGGLVDSDEVTKCYKKMKSGNPDYFVSRYAQTNQHEYFAELFSAYTSPHYKKGMFHPDMEALFKNLE